MIGAGLGLTALSVFGFFYFEEIWKRVLCAILPGLSILGGLYESILGRDLKRGLFALLFIAIIAWIVYPLAKKSRLG